MGLPILVYFRETMIYMSCAIKMNLWWIMMTNLINIYAIFVLFKFTHIYTIYLFVLSFYYLDILDWVYLYL